VRSALAALALALVAPGGAGAEEAVSQILFHGKGLGVSDDGLIVGWSRRDGPIRPYRAIPSQSDRPPSPYSSSDGPRIWSAQSLGELPADLGPSAATAVSADGTGIVGFLGSGEARAFLWNDPADFVDLGVLPGDAHSRADAVSADASVVVGASGGGDREEAFRWTEAGGMQGLGDFAGGRVWSRAEGVSADGSVIVGTGETAAGEEAFRWTPADGMQGLGGLGGKTSWSRARNVSADGRVVVGASKSAWGREAFRWTEEEGMRGLGDLPGGRFASEAWAASADGSVIVGSASTARGKTAFVWTRETGMVSLEWLLRRYGRSFSAYAPKMQMEQLTSALAVSADGRIITGTGFDHRDRLRGFGVRLPSPRGPSFRQDVGDVFVVDGDDAILRIDPETGAQSRVPLPDLGGLPLGIDGIHWFHYSLDGWAADHLVIADAGEPGEIDGKLIGFHPSYGTLSDDSPTALEVRDPNTGEVLLRGGETALVDPSAVLHGWHLIAAGDEQDVVSLSYGREGVLYPMEGLWLDGLAETPSGPVLMVSDGEQSRIVNIEVVPVAGTEGEVQGVPEVISSGGFLANPRGLATDCRSQVYTVDEGARIVRIDPESHDHTILAAGDFAGVESLDIDGFGRLVLSQPLANGGRILRVDPLDGSTQVLAEGDLLGDPRDLVLGYERHWWSQRAGLGIDGFCGGHGRPAGRELLRLPAEEIGVRRSIELALRLGGEVWSAELDDAEGGQLVIGGRAHWSGNMLEDRPIPVTLDLDAPSRQQLFAWLQQRLGDLRGKPTSLHPRSRPRIRMLLNADRTRVEISLRWRLFAMTGEGPQRVKYGFDVEGPVEDLVPPGR
jgi:probable HAF family extracellular repeat protein